MVKHMPTRMLKTSATPTRDAMPHQADWRYAACCVL